MPPTEPWEIPHHSVTPLHERRTRYCVVVPVINEGERIRRQLARMRHQAGLADILIADGGSTDTSLDLDHLRECGVRALLVKQDEGRLAAQLRMAFAFAMEEGYEGVVTVDGNDKDGVDAVPRFLDALATGDDFVQGSRFVDGGHHANTPATRLLAIRLVHAPVISALAHHRYTDTTNGFRGHSRRLLLDPRLQLFRSAFVGYELLPYLSIKAARLGFRVAEVPVSRVYPRGERTPTKLGAVRGPVELLRVLWEVGRGRLDPGVS